MNRVINRINGRKTRDKGFDNRVINNQEPILRLCMGQRYINYGKPVKRKRIYELYVYLRINSNNLVFNELNCFLCAGLFKTNRIRTINTEIMNKTTRLLGSLLIITIATSCGTGGKNQSAQTVPHRRTSAP